MTNETGLRFQWSPAYQPKWDADPGAYAEAGVVGWGRSRRLARAEDPVHRFKAYVGVHHSDPAQWGVAGAPSTKFFLSIFINGRTVAFRTFPTLPQTLAELHQAHAFLLKESRI